MAQQKQIKIDLPGSPEVLHDLMRFLLQHGLISENEAHTIEEKKPSKTAGNKSRWAKAAQRFRSEGFLTGQGDQVKEYIREFREGFGDGMDKRFNP
jgi:hypothetical protein